MAPSAYRRDLTGWVVKPVFDRVEDPLVQLMRDAQVCRREFVGSGPAGPASTKRPGEPTSSSRPTPRLLDCGRKPDLDVTARCCENASEGLHDDLLGTFLVPGPGHRVAIGAIFELAHRRFERRPTLRFQLGLPYAV